MSHMDISIIIASAPSGIFQSFHTTEPPAVRSGSTWFCELLVLKETCAGHTALCNEKCSPREAGEADPMHRCPPEGQWEESCSESILSYQVEKEHVKYKGFKV